MSIPSHITYSIVPLTSLLLKQPGRPSQITGELFVSVDKACHALDELTLPKAMLKQLNGNIGWVIPSTVRLKQ